VAGLIHQVWQGDSIELCEKFKPGRVNCIITDPPFGVDNQSNMAVTEHGKKHARKIANDESPIQALKVFVDVMDVLLPKLADEADVYIFTSQQVLKEWLVACDLLMERYGLKRSGILIWQKDGPGMGDLDAAWGMAHEFILYYKKGRRPRTDGVPRRSGVLHVPQLRPTELIHPHEKPTALLDLLIKWSTSPGDFLVDPFGGSGSLVRAALHSGRSAVAIELDEYNARSARERLTEGTGLF
jgi:adenine-specific DNA-methyltransferase